MFFSVRLFIDTLTFYLPSFLIDIFHWKPNSVIHDSYDFNPNFVSLLHNLKRRGCEVISHLTYMY